MSIVSTNNSGVVLIDPNKENVNPFLPNGLPKYEDMFINVSLMARRRSRSVIYTNGNLLRDYDNTDESVISFIGMNQRDGDINKGKFTTNYYDGSTGEYITDESFGIKSIKIITDSSYIPRVEIQFLDVRGLSFFSNEKSKYRMLFDFPPPIFELNVKGYYGAPLKYLLHLTSYKTDFDDSNASHIINANFVALTYAPLTDIPFRYIYNFGMMEDNSMNYNPDTSEKPKNTYELSLKLKSLYSSISGVVKGSDENKKRENAINRIDKINNAINYIGTVDGKDGIFGKTKPSFYLIDNTIEGDDSNKIVRLRDLNDYLRSITTNGLIDKDKIVKSNIYCGFENYPDNFGVKDGFRNKQNLDVGDVVASIGELNRNNKIKKLEKYRNNIKDFVKELAINENIRSVDSSKRSEYSAFFDDILVNGQVTYILLDIKDVLQKLLQEREKQISIRDKYGSEISNKINELVKTKLGMNPTISEIFGIILNDVDTFFSVIRRVSKDAEDEKFRETRNKLLGGDTKDKFNGKIYPFPLVIKQETGKCGHTETRIAPIRQAQLEYIPEMELVLRFIKSFTEQRQRSRLYDIKERTKEDEVNIWIPLSPIDSKTANPEISLNSPYYFFVNQHNIPEHSGEIKEMYRTIVKRFIAISQNSQKNIFDWSSKNKSKKPFIELFAMGEAINLISSTTNEKSLDIIRNGLSKFTNENQLINELIKHDISDTEKLNLNVHGAGEILYYNNRNNVNFRGFNIIVDDIYFTQNIEDDEEGNIFVKFKNKTKRGFWDYLNIFSDKGKHDYLGFTDDNLLYYTDRPEKKLAYRIWGINPENKIIDEYDGNHLITKFLDGNYKYGSDIFTIFDRGGTTTLTTNKELRHVEPVFNRGSNIITHWSETLRIGFFRELVKTLGNSETNDDMFLLLVLSNFGSTLSPFNSGKFRMNRDNSSSPSFAGYNNLNKGLFSQSGVVEIPKFVLLYLGLLIHIKSSDSLILKFEELLDIEYNRRKLRNFAQYITADLNDVENYLSDNDKEYLVQEYLDFKNTNYETIKNTILSLINKQGGVSIDETNVNFYDLLNPSTNDGETFYRYIFEPLIKRINMLVYSSNTFSFSKIEEDGTYLKLSDYISKSGENVTIFFKEFLSTVKNNLPKISKKIEEETADLRKITEDNDIINQTYYSFKNIHDKWISGVGDETSSSGYPFIADGKLKDYFVFVDRAMNDIGDTMINAELLLDLFDDNEASVFTVISQLLSNNGFEFFPLQNFMTHETNSWENSFKINTNTKVNLNSFFVCMYIGGVSSYLNNPDSEIPNDGIVSLDGEALLDFDKGCEGKIDTSETKGSSKFKYSNVFAFIVRYGQQNQSMFKDIKISTREFPETNESIQILSRLAKDESDVQPIPKGQNLYSLYENRAYSASVTTLGNMMIQPTQYFQLENVQLYNGVYIILSVEHNITPNFMETKFDGTKILKYPTPRVTSPVAFTEFAGFDNQSIGEITAAVMNDTSKYGDNIRYESIYTHKIG